MFSTLDFENKPSFLIFRIDLKGSNEHPLCAHIPFSMSFEIVTYFLNLIRLCRRPHLRAETPTRSVSAKAASNLITIREFIISPLDN